MNYQRKINLQHRAAVFADKMRDELHLTSVMPISIHQVLREKCIQAYFRQMNDGSSGMAIKVNESLLFMMINTSMPLGHQRFTCCHEFYHLLFQKDFSSVNEKTAEFRETDENEFTADWFASYLLLPEAGIKRLLPSEEQNKNRVSIDSLLKIEHTFRCSRRTLLYRLKDMSLIDGDFYEKYSKGIICTSNQYGYPTAIYKPTNKTEYIGDYNIKARQLFNRGIISQAQYDSLLEDIGIHFSLEPEENGEL